MLRQMARKTHLDGSLRTMAIDDVDARLLVTDVGPEAGADSPQLRAESLPRILRVCECSKDCCLSIRVQKLRAGVI